MKTSLGSMWKVKDGFELELYPYRSHSLLTHVVLSDRELRSLKNQCNSLFGVAFKTSAPEGTLFVLVGNDYTFPQNDIKEAIRGRTWIDIMVQGLLFTIPAEALVHACQHLSD